MKITPSLPRRREPGADPPSYLPPQGGKGIPAFAGMTSMNDTLPRRWPARVFAVRPAEERALCGSFAYFFCLLAGYYVLRPLRDEMGIAGGVPNLPWLFTATF